MNRQVVVLGVLATLVVGAVALAGYQRFQGSSQSPYIGFQTRAIKALTDTEVAELREGRGMGMALAAELNGYPGPRHVLELADRIGLAPSQRATVEDLFARMQREAIAQSEKVILAERSLDALFGSATATEEGLAQAVRVAAETLGTLRLIHLRYHIEVRQLMSAGQIAAYQRLRGYGDHGSGHGTHGGRAADKAAS